MCNEKLGPVFDLVILALGYRMSCIRENNFWEHMGEGAKNGASDGIVLTERVFCRLERDLYGCVCGYCPVVLKQA